MFDSPTTHAASLSARPRTYQNGGPPIRRQENPPVNARYYSGGQRSLAGISCRAFCLGTTLGVSLSLLTVLVLQENGLWRLPFFIATLCVFHYLEFDMTARFNTADAKLSSYLLSSNGSAYNIAHATAVSELLFRSWTRSTYKPDWFELPFQIPTVIPDIPHWLPLLGGGLLVIGGQYARSAAMATAGNSFNHLVQSTKKDNHQLITHGIYAFSRHPSYFGFFWWGIGTQVVIGNRVCLFGYAYVLWKFFASRITSEEDQICTGPLANSVQKRSLS